MVRGTLNIRQRDDSPRDHFLTPATYQSINSWCPHCRHFAPQYIEFSTKLAQLAEAMQVNVETYAVSCVPNMDICSGLHIFSFPTIMLFPPNSSNGTKVKASDLHPMDVMRIFGITGDRKSQPEADPRDGQPPKADSDGKDAKHHILSQNQKGRDMNDRNHPLSLQHYFMHRSKEQTFQDAHLSFDFSMKTAVYTSLGPLPEQPKKALSKFLGILQRTLPVSSTMQPVVNELIQNFDGVCQDDANLLAVMERHPPPAATWSPASLQHGTGYTAGLWLLFHIMSVGFVEWNHMAISDDQKLAPTEVADSLRGYIEFFFQCEVCRVNFLTEYDACSHDRCNRLTAHRKGTLQEYIQYPLWLYETHNAVNVRLRKERIELHDEAEGTTTEVQVMWPPTDLCPSCWLSEGRWDEMTVFEGLLDAYWQVVAFGGLAILLSSAFIKLSRVTDAHSTLPMYAVIKLRPESDHSQVLRTLHSNRTDAKSPKNENFPSDDFRGAGFKFPFSAVTVFSVSLMMFVVWQRKLRFDRKGIHKKKESDVA
jgi:thiol oxidase